MASTHEFLRRLRDLVNEPGMRSRLMKERAMWLQLASSLDAIGDCEMAINAYLSEPMRGSASPVEELGVRYLKVYGVLQALFVQQDALSNLLESLNVSLDLDNYPELQEIRNIRIRSVGHPTKVNRKKRPSYHGIVQISLRDETFQLYSRSADGNWELQSINIPALISQQQACTAQILDHAIAQLQNQRA